MYSKATQTKRFFPKKGKEIILGDKAKIVEKRPRIPLELKSYSGLVKIADTLFAKEVKRRADQGGWVQCFTCPAKLSYSPDKGNKNLHVSHFQSRRCHPIRWSFDNSRVACANCNKWNQGRMEVYEPKLIREIGAERVNELKAIAAKTNIQDRDFVIQVINNLKLLKKYPK